ncbi:sigma-54-dependent Fis family transcriptional regulator [Neptuniibacter sp. 1_MG-2023]|uniref:sigma-54-dependent Fis family transcriptional regulator n=1 Tax=Neptuniibacter sp. 1_MG-2023 TaxID=3062662 RepID=UPI0026E16D32|nr:sigma-54-dependent Fis family transcriptional regulator [Neptuniibacter sp. 1_MG-2023]MDO6594707.1 sigma-54-dependent Fis family transcriptional regulator [Neptuniibacter sp. 1_MG-2023]
MSSKSVDHSNEKGFHAGNPPKNEDALTDRYIENSWERCRDRYKISQHADVKFVSLTDSEFKERREPLEKLLSDSIGVFDKIRTLSKNSGYTVLITNEEGVAVKSFAESSVGHDLVAKGLRQGTLWSESIVGTNGVGTCLTECSPVTVYAEEHYGNNLQSFSCSAAPLISPDGTPFGAIDASTFANGNRLGQALALNMVCETADEIEALVFKDAYHNQRVVSFSVSPVVSITKALVAVNDSGTIVAATTPILLTLGCRDRYEIVGKKFQDVFNLSFEQLEAAGSGSVEHYMQVMGKPYKFHVNFLQNNAYQIQSHQPRTTTAKPLEVDSNLPVNTPLILAAGKEPTLLKQATRCQRIINKGISILLQGETGTGKEVWARALHNSSDRADKPFITLNCAAIPESLIESELFGYGAGTFTGGLKAGKMGKIQASDGGTLFLDEIGDMPLELQASLLRVLAESEIIPLGEHEPVGVSLNVICATHRDLKEYVARGEFREDLYYRIGGFQVTLPSLRQRSDQPVIIDKVLQALCLDEGEVDQVEIHPEAMDVLSQYSWPGNIRQLKNVLQYALCMKEGDMIRLDDLPDEVFSSEALLQKEHEDVNTVPPLRVLSIASDSGRLSEKEQLESILEQHRWVVTRAAKAMGVSRSTLHRKIKKYGLLSEDQLSEQ